MAYEIPGIILGTLKAAGDYNDSTDQFCVVQQTSGALFATCTTGSQDVIGILQDKPSSGYAGQIMIHGVSKVRVISTGHGAIAVGDKLCASSEGGAVRSTLGTHYVFGRAMEALAANTTGIITCFLSHPGSGSTGAAGAA